MHFGYLSWVKAKDHLTVHLRHKVMGKKAPLLHTNPKVCGWQSRKELPLLSDCTTELKCPVRKSRHFQIYRWINWQCWECLTGHSSWRLLVQQCARTGLLRFDFLSWSPWQMCCREGGDDEYPHLSLLLGPTGVAEMDTVKSWYLVVESEGALTLIMVSKIQTKILQMEYYTG